MADAVAQDIRQAAHVAVFEFEDWVQRSQHLFASNPEGTEAREQLAEVIARAILAEREAQKERDARICDAVANEHAQWKNDGISADAAEECAAAIRKGGA